MVLFYYSMALLPYAFTRVLTFYFFARHEGGVFLRYAIFLYGLTLAFDLLYVGGLGLGEKGIPLALLTASIVTHVLAYKRNLVELRSVFDGSLGWFALKNLMAAVFVALAILGLRSIIPYPQTGLANFMSVCILCSAGSLVFFATLAATRAVPLAQVIEELKRTEDS
jgi:peptidoglycan biosynthesis protein MviN/MurJ (putative lipid II flippase)